MKCYICNKKLEKGYLCKEHALELKEMLGKRINIIEHPDWKYHCQICGEHEGKIMVEYPNYGYYCDTDINEACDNYLK